MNLIKYPNEFLEREVKDVDLENPGFDPVELKKEMVDFMIANNGIGLSANQIGLDAKVFVMGDSVENSTMCINPTVLQYTSDTQDDIEGCLSFPNVFVKIKRPKEILKWDMAQKKARKLEKQFA
jgi:peptide deformylase